MNKFLIHHRSQHHASNSGYGRLMDYLDAEVIYGSTKFPYRLAKIFAGFQTQAKGNYTTGSTLKAIELYKQLKENKGQNNVVHFLNGERDIRHLGFFKRSFPNTRFCASFHKPPEILKQTIPNPAALQKLDAAIAVGINQVDFLKDWLQIDDIAYIPHGVDTQFFVPDIYNKKRNTLLFVGQHLRDFETFNKTVPTLAEKVKDLKVNVVIHPAYKDKILPHSCVNILTGVKDEQLRLLYQEASLLYLPMLDSTACNSLLEAMACGLPIITSKVGGNEIYLKDTSNVLCESGNVGKFIDETVALLQVESRLEAIGKTSRKKALELEWSNIAKDVQGFYKKLN
ncbi:MULTISPECIES: glycosyltransferase family 4 protein [Aequorivita]|uniref:Glycosyltransferase n=1 Tax=Aequorivita iocasae TaxID=2803865 RepID=A0ABX7DS10_9FLAO|nr:MULTISPECIES: glycosyltransferase [Aequorivita]QQX76788.1 glycosyltransferase [Aequorivita iocasae]UCA56260.1 glycosyltransferase [Aequorivita sp. F7]